MKPWTSSLLGSRRGALGGIWLAFILLTSASEVRSYYAVCIWDTMVSDVKIEDATFDEVIECLRINAQKADREGKGVNIVIKSRSKIASAAKISLQIPRAKIADALKLVGRMTRMRVREEPYAFVMSSLD